MATTVKRDRETKSPTNLTPPLSLPLVVTLNCIEDTSIEQEFLAGVAFIEHVPLSRLTNSPIESAAAVLLHSLSFLPRAAQRRLRPWQLILCLGSSDRSVDSALAADLGLRRFLHVDVSRAEETADTVMALFLGLLRRTHLLMHHTLSASGWLGSVQPLFSGMRRCRGLVLGIIGRSASAKALAARSLAFKIRVLYYDVPEDPRKSIRRSSITFPPAVRRMDTLNDLLAASDLISLHCDLTDDTVQILNSDCLQHIKPGAFLVNTASSELLDDCAVKQLLIDGTLAGCALDGAEGPQWMEAWVREMPNVLILPCSAAYSEEAWMEIREKAVSILQAYFLEDVIPTNGVSDSDEEESEVNQVEKKVNDTALQGIVRQQLTNDIHVSPDTSTKMDIKQAITSQNASASSNVTCSRSGKKFKKGRARKKSSRINGETSTLEIESSSHREDDTAMSGTDQALSSSSNLASPKDPETIRTAIAIGKNSLEQLKDGCVISLQTRDCSALHVSRQRAQGGGWFLDVGSNVTARDPAAQFLVVFRGKDTIGLRSFTAGGKLLQINRRMEFGFASHSFDSWESWTYEGSLEECRLINCTNPSAVLNVRVEILATVGDDDGITRWLD